MIFVFMLLYLLSGWLATSHYAFELLCLFRFISISMGLPLLGYEPLWTG